MPILKGVPDYAVYAGGGLVLGGGYLLYKKRKAASASATSSAPVSSGADLSGVYGGSSGQQSSVVPYYLTGNQSSTDWRNGGVTQSPPLPTPSGTPGGSGSVVSGTGIPPILPPTPTAPTPAPPAPTPPAPSPAPPAPAPAQNNSLPADLLQRIQAAGEAIIGSAAAPGGGAWYAGSKGGVFAVNAPFYGSMFGYLPAGVTVTGIQPQGNGYVLQLSNGDRRPYNV